MPGVPRPASLDRYPIDGRPEGWHTTADGERYFYIPTPSAGLWATREKLYGRPGGFEGERFWQVAWMATWCRLACHRRLFLNANSGQLEGARPAGEYNEIIAELLILDETTSVRMGSPPVATGRP